MDTLLTVCVGLLQFGAMVLGIRVSLKSPAEHHHGRFIAAFCVIGLLGIALNVIQQSRSSTAQESLRQQIGRIEKNTKTPPSVQVTNNVPAPQLVFPPAQAATARIVLTTMSSSYPDGSQKQQQGSCSAEATVALVVGKVVSYNVCFKNDGTASADDTRTIGKLYFATASSAAIEEGLRGRFEKYLAQRVNESTGSTFEPNSPEIFTTVASDRVVTMDDPTLLVDRKEFLYMFLSATYKDTSGDHYQHYCRIFVPPQADPNHSIGPNSMVFTSWITSCHVYGDHK